MAPDPGSKDLWILALVVIAGVIIGAFIDRTIVTPVTDKFIGKLNV